MDLISHNYGGRRFNYNKCVSLHFCVKLWYCVNKTGFDGNQEPN